MAAGHSPGPWRLEKHDDGGLVLRAADGTLLARVFRGILGADVAEANARLMKQAPRLLESSQAMEMVLSLLGTDCADSSAEGQRCGECLGCAIDAALTAVRTSIAEAEGQEVS